MENFQVAMKRADEASFPLLLSYWLVQSVAAVTLLIDITRQ